jgi:phosphoglycerate dehydrogenase-like enzyme
MLKVAVTQPLGLNERQRERLKKLGDVRFYDEMPSSPEEWLDRVKDADIICTGKFGFKIKAYELKNTFVSVPFVAIDWIDQDKLNQNNVVVQNCPGCNKEAVSEWIVGMMINLMRRFPKYINTREPVKGNPAIGLSIAGKTVLVCGTGNIGSRVGKICDALGADVDHFRRGDNLIEKAGTADVIVDALASNKETYKTYDRAFFQSLKKGAYFITVTGDKLWDADAIIEALDEGILAGVATDVGSVQVGTTDSPLYKRFANHPKVYATPHIAYDSDRSDLVCNNVMIDNVESWIKSKENASD